MLSFTSSIPVVGTHDHHIDSTSLKKVSVVDKSGLGGGPENERTYTPILHCIFAGGIGGAIGDSSMHSLDTVKTRQQGAPNAVKYKNMIIAYRTIVMEEGLRRGLYSGYTAAMLGSFPSAAIFFGTYEMVKRKMINDWKLNETMSYLTAGLLGDLFSSVVYVPSEVLKTRLQLQGKYNNPHFYSGYNYKNLRDAIFTIIRKEGYQTLFFGYKATLSRDLPFSGLQFAFYEKFRQWAFTLEKKNIDDDLAVISEIITGAAAGGLAGILTTPLDVIKTRVQTQLPSTTNYKISKLNKIHHPAILSNSIFKGLILVHKSEGLVGLFSGVGPRFIWTSIQSSIMLLLYQVTLRTLDKNFSTQI